MTSLDAARGHADARTPAIAPGMRPTVIGGSPGGDRGDRTNHLPARTPCYDVHVSPDFEAWVRARRVRAVRPRRKRRRHLFRVRAAVGGADRLRRPAFYPDPADCTITPGTLNPATGIASARLECPDLEDVRGSGTVTLDGGGGPPRGPAGPARRPSAIGRADRDRGSDAGLQRRPDARHERAHRRDAARPTVPLRG